MNRLRKTELLEGIETRVLPFLFLEYLKPN